MKKPSKKISGKLATVTALSLVLAILVGVTVWLEVRREPANHKLQQSETTPVTTPELTTPEQTMPEHTTPEQTTIQQQTTPLSTTPEQTTIPQTTPGQTTPQPTTPAQTTPRPTSAPPSVPTITPEPTYPDVEVKTPYATLYYPGQYKEYLKTEIIDDGISATILFYSEVEGREALLFTIFFGGADGYPIGVYKADKGFTMDVTAEISGQIPDGSWSSVDSDIFYAMQEGMNHVISRLEDAPGFTPIQP